MSGSYMLDTNDSGSCALQRSARGHAAAHACCPAPAVKGGQSSKFSLPVDKENKATTIRLWSFAFPHMTAFHLAWFSFFIRCAFVAACLLRRRQRMAACLLTRSSNASFCSTFMAAPLMPIIREDLNMTQTQVGNANSASVAGTVFFRILMGSLCDSVGPRKAYGVLMILVSFPCFAMSACPHCAS